MVVITLLNSSRHGWLRGVCLTYRMDVWMPLIKSEVIAGDIYRVISCADDAQGELHICEIIVPDVIEWPFHCVHCTAHQGYETQPASCML